MFNLLPAILLILMNGSLSGELRDSRLQILLSRDPVAKALMGSIQARVLGDEQLGAKGPKASPLRIGLAILLSLTPRESHSDAAPSDEVDWHLHPEPPGIRLTPSHGSQNRSRDGPRFA